MSGVRRHKQLAMVCVACCVLAPWLAYAEEASTPEERAAVSEETTSDDDAKADAAAIENAPADPGKWSDANGLALDLAQGSMELCELLTLPLGLVPQVGFFIELGVDAACIVPGAYSVDYVHAYHGERQGGLWQAYSALALSKIWRDVTRWPVLVVVGGATFAAVAVSVAVAITLTFTVTPFALLYLPLAIGGVLGVAGATFMVTGVVRRIVADGIFHGTHRMLTKRFPNEETQEAAQKRTALHPPFKLPVRVWTLAVVASGVDGPRHALDFVPVFGPIYHAWYKAGAVKEVLRRVSKDEFTEGDRDFTNVDRAVGVLNAADGTLGAVSHVALVGGALLFIAGAGVSLVGLFLGPLGLPFALVALGAGIAGLTGALTALGAMGARNFVGWLQPLVIPAAFGLRPKFERAAAHEPKPESEVAPPSARPDPEAEVN